ncbi:ABC transporter substrate-binding protein [Caldimonas thermodepolymerans]|uniref:Amino acid/amide ABC transporter substrate-binding protein (HAAT family) n=1 Tax=Caldimonas thermodepolymerans TaxID=215580 RepID=A0A2S5T767_9BURK|nr:ABC transporter substrate-binding protein [Caldimonas thermodepolymerans]PPE70789.1 branched-chain amino acid ABC transporter substrate-binding protein [Caldimonas thermodepolymerans]QPC33007.1 ABC transporter substrate-binding protein [Caldimonas thermodepolymerans]RDI03791.1 amino acid/amide ABC transporter substrate-binding protein (HAAT family) [Caldimonas thermodepolymerans]TCP09758.1 amino acid/amide ABC transporter substrate-binding protein (HAAT family) [Caldimonas thermodepolymerans
MKRPALKQLVVTLFATLAAGVAHADLNIGVVLPLTGPASGLGIPVNNGFKLWPDTIAGEKVKLTVLDDATDPANGVKNARRLVTEEKVDLIIGSAATPVAVAVADVAAEAQTPQLAMSPIPLPPGKDTWSFRMAHSSAVMAHAMVEHMKKQGVKTVGFLGYTDAYGETWLKDFTAKAEPAGIKLVAVERFQRTDTSVTGQALKLVSANPDAMLIVASGSGAAMPHRAVVERGYKGKIYQTHAAASRDLVRVGGKDVEGAFVVSGPATVAEQLPESHPSKKEALKYVQGYEKLYGAGSRNQFGAHTYDALLILERAVPEALKKAKPGTKEFRAALRDAIESVGPVAASQGVLHFKPDDHWGFTNDSAVVMKVVNGDWKVEQ